MTLPRWKFLSCFYFFLTLPLGVQFWVDFDPIFGKCQELWEYHCGQGVTRMTQDISVSIAHVQEIVLYPGPEKLSVKLGVAMSSTQWHTPSLNILSSAPNGQNEQGPFSPAPAYTFSYF